jgi:hypothetical protein
LIVLLKSIFSRAMTELGTRREEPKRAEDVLREMLEAGRVASQARAKEELEQQKRADARRQEVQQALREAMRPEFKTQYEEISAKIGYPVSLRINGDWRTDQPPKLIGNGKDEPYRFFVQRYAFQWTPELARRMMPSDEEISSMFLEVDPEVKQIVEQEAKHLGVPNVSAVGKFGGSAALTSREGNHYVLVGIPQEDMAHIKGTITHELGHLKLGHTSPEEAAKVSNMRAAERLAYARQLEREADQYAVAHCAAPMLIEGLKPGIRLVELEAEEKGISVAEIEALGEHPPGAERLEALRSGHNEMIKQGVCSVSVGESQKPAPTPPVSAPTRREKPRP